LRVSIRSGPLAIAAVSCIVLAVTVGNTVVAAAKLGQRSVSRLAAENQRSGEQYFVDFRARPGTLVGHTFIVYGRLNARGQLLDVRYAGIYPEDEHLGLVVGTVIPVRASVRGVAGDVKQSATIVYRRQLNATEFARLTAAVRRQRVTERHWHLLFYNCNDVAVEIAKSLGLYRPSPLLLPNAFVAALRALNGH
jgi:hypothetical protein